LPAAHIDRSPASYVVNSFLAQTRDRFISKRQLTAGLGPGLHCVALANRLVDHHRARRCTGWYDFNVLHYLGDFRLMKVLCRQIIWQPIYQGTCDWGDQ
jgi:hypothetical protein